MMVLPMKIVLFDVDHTLIKHSTARYFIYHAVRKGIFPKKLVISFPYYYLKYRTGKLDDAFFFSTFTALQGKEKEVLTQCADECMNTSIVKDLYRKAVDILEHERARGNLIVLASSSIELFIRPLARYLEVDFISSRLEFENGKSTGRFLGKPAFGEEKKAMVTRYVQEKGLTLKDCEFYSDSHYDLPLLQAVGTPIAVNPDVKLNREAKKHGWNILTFRRRV